MTHSSDVWCRCFFSKIFLRNICPFSGSIAGSGNFRAVGEPSGFQRIPQFLLVFGLEHDLPPVYDHNQLSNFLGSLFSTQFGWSRMSIFCCDGSSTRESSDEISRIGWWAAHDNPYLVGYILVRYIQHKLGFSHILQPIEPSSFRLTRVAPCSEVIIIKPSTGGEVLIPVDGWWGWSLSPLRPTCQTLKQWHPANMRCQWNTFFIWTPSGVSFKSPAQFLPSSRCCLASLPCQTGVHSRNRYSDVYFIIDYIYGLCTLGYTIYKDCI